MREYYLFVIGYIFLAFVFFYLGTYKKIGRKRLFLISLILTPIVATVFFFVTPNRIDYKVYRYKCPNCGFSFEKNLRTCPYCKEDGKKYVLRKVKRTMT
jgi:hypothetical protein